MILYVFQGAQADGNSRTPNEVRSLHRFHDKLIRPRSLDGQQKEATSFSVLNLFQDCRFGFVTWANH